MKLLKVSFFMFRTFFIFLFFVLTGCSTNHLYVQMQKIDKGFLASNRVNTPDIRKKNPPYGQQINITWYFPKHWFYQKLSIYLTARFWDNTEEIRSYNISKKWGTVSFFFPNPSKMEKNKILTYKIDIINDKKDVLQTWLHQLWTEKIDIDIEK